MLIGRKEEVMALTDAYKSDRSHLRLLRFAIFGRFRAK